MTKTLTKLSGRHAFLAAAALLLSLTAAAHIKNEASQFPDIEFSDARFDIVLLVGAGIIPETPVFEPDSTLSRRELAVWAALARGLGSGGETPDPEALAAATVEAGVLGDLAGNATYDDINRVLFDGAIDVTSPEATPSKADAARFVASHLDSDAGLSLLDRRSLSPGATGGVAAVETRKGDHGNVYVITIGEKSLPMDAHGRVANGPTDLTQWEGKHVLRSFVSGDDSARWIYLEAGRRQDPPVAETSGGETDAVQTAAVEAADAEDAPRADRQLLYWLVGAVLLLSLVLFFRRRKHD